MVLQDIDHLHHQQNLNIILIRLEVRVIKTTWFPIVMQIMQEGFKDLQTGSLVPVTGVRYVIVENLGVVSYIKGGKREAFVVVEADGRVFYGDSGEIE